MWEDIKGILGGTIRFVFWTIVFSFCFGYTLGNYYGMKSSYENPRKFQFNIFPGYFVMMVENPEMKKFQ